LCLHIWKEINPTRREVYSSGHYADVSRYARIPASDIN